VTATMSPPSTEPASPPPGSRRHARVALIIGVALALGLGVGLALGLGGSSPTEGPNSSALYGYYQSMMGRNAGGSMMGDNGAGSMMGQYGYTWMMGGTSAPQWMLGHGLPESMMGSSADPGQVMGRLFADEPGPRVSATQAATLGNQVPADATVDRSTKTVTFSGSAVHLTVVASPPGGPDETFRAAGMVTPTIVVPVGAQVTLSLVNADPDTAHGLVVATSGARSTYMPMMTAQPAFSGSALWFLGVPTSAGMHTGTITFTARTAGSYSYYCPVPGHAQKGMVGPFVVSA
jgi:rusticyanin